MHRAPRPAVRAQALSRARLVLAVVLLTGSAALGVPAAAQAYTKMPNVTIPASDGVNLVGDVYLPNGPAGRHPAVVDMEPYGRSTSTAYVDHGYARVNTDVRG